MKIEPSIYEITLIKMKTVKLTHVIPLNYKRIFDLSPHFSHFFKQKKNFANPTLKILLIASQHFTAHCKHQFHSPFFCEMKFMMLKNFIFKSFQKNR